MWNFFFASFYLSIFFFKSSSSVEKVTQLVQLLFRTSYRVPKDIYFDIRACAWSHLALLEKREWISGIWGTSPQWLESESGDLSLSVGGIDVVLCIPLMDSGMHTVSVEQFCWKIGWNDSAFYISTKILK